MRHSKLPQPPVEHDSESLGARWTEAMRAGDFAAAWDVSDRVLAGRDPAARDDPALPYHLRWVWDGRPFDGRDVLVRCYHGLGDTLQFCRYLAPLRRRARRLTLELQPELHPLLAGLPGPDRMVPFTPAAPGPGAECELEIMELAHALRAPPDPAPYLAIDPAPLPGGALRVGFCWRVTTGWSPERSAPADAMARLAAVPGVRPFSLQPGAALRGAAPCPESLLGTARLVAGLDLVVTVDSMVAHLAGALGTPVWLLLIAEPDWRWLPGEPDSPWYRAVRKYRQERPGEWDRPLAAVTADLTEAARRHSVAGTEGLVGGL